MLWGSPGGGGNFLRDGSLRLGLPFVVAAALVAPLAYCPADLKMGAGVSLRGYWQQWMLLG